MNEVALNWSKLCAHSKPMHLEDATELGPDWYQPVSHKCEPCAKDLARGIRPLAFKFGDSPERKPKT